MDESFVFLTICVFLLVAFVVNLILAFRGNLTAKYFLWTWAAFLVVLLPFTIKSNIISSLPAVLALVFLLYVSILENIQSNVQTDVSHEETRRVLAELNRRIDEERRMISRRLHDDVNPNLVLCKNELNRLAPYVQDNPEASKILTSIQELLADAYSQTRNIIKSARIEMIDSIGFTVAIESLISHYTNFFDKPEIVLEHNLPKRPEINEEVAITAYKIIRESIYNAIKHSNAKQISVSMKLNERKRLIEVMITDDGVGLKSRAKTPAGIPAGIGLIDMRERARAIGGNLNIQPAFPDNAQHPGTRVTFSFSTRS
ncbi:sensor histidine kinase [Sulfuricystis multivorans]|uniref:sensor histidine kinase n=1 Tax=Sulfuricystis multivorans TaxID=2211108 RepID=UPI000F8433A8|nr:histidine kinase [Sulfuricystis multivorans]